MHAERNIHNTMFEFNLQKKTLSFKEHNKQFTNHCSVSTDSLHTCT